MSTNTKISVVVLVLLAAVLVFMLYRWSSTVAPGTTSPGTFSVSEKQVKKVRIGFSMADLKEERWKRDRDMFVKKAEELGAMVDVQDAGGKPETQKQQCEAMLQRGIDVLVIIPKNAVAARTIVDKAEEKQVPVFCYDRVIKHPGVSLYVSFDNYEVGRIQAREILRRVPNGNYMLLGGDPGDENATMLRQGQMEVLKSAIDAGDIKVVYDQFCDKWSRSKAKEHTEAALAKCEGKLDAVVASNDGTAAGVIAALEAKGLAGKVAVSGQDADLLSCQYVVQGKQTVTAYKPIRELAEKSAELAMKLARREETGAKLMKFGDVEVPTIFLKPIPVTAENIDETVIADGFHAKGDIYKGE